MMAVIASQSLSGGCRRAIVLDHRGGVFFLLLDQICPILAEKVRGACVYHLCVPVSISGEELNRGTGNSKHHCLHETQTLEVCICVTEMFLA